MGVRYAYMRQNLRLLEHSIHDHTASLGFKHSFRECLTRVWRNFHVYMVTSHWCMEASRALMPPLKPELILALLSVDWSQLRDKISSWASYVLDNLTVVNEWSTLFAI